jgi:hypothetical protein
MGVMVTGVGMNVGNIVSRCPVAAFSSVMGICGLGLCWPAAAEVLKTPQAIWEGLVAVAAVLFVVLGTVYILKLFIAPDAVAAEFRNPATSSQFGCVTIALLLLAAGILPYAPQSALAIWSVGAAGQCLLLLTLLGRWISEPTKVGNSTPSWLIPIVGNATAAFAGVPLGFPEISWFLFAVGLGFWLTFLPLLPWLLEGPDGSEFIQIRSPLQVNIAESLVVAIRERMGSGMLPLYAAVDGLRDGTLVRVLPNHTLQNMNIYALYASRKFTDAKVLATPGLPCRGCSWLTIRLINQQNGS